MCMRPMRDENGYDVLQDRLNKTIPFEKYVAIVENKDAELNRKLKN
jgi:hypothetical protein